MINNIRFNIVNLHPFFCEYSDLDGSVDFKFVTKREIIQPFALFYASKEFISQLSPDTFETEKTSDVIVNKISIKISIAELASFTCMVENTMNILEEKYLKWVWSQSDSEMKNFTNTI